MQTHKERTKTNLFRSLLGFTKADEKNMQMFWVQWNMYARSVLAGSSFVQSRRLTP
jgi:hypothetical protein